MRKIQILLVVLASLTASNAFASRATNLVMGTGDAGTVLNGGSLYYDDAYNIFYNPAYINDFKNFAIIEKSNAPGLSAQGGFTTSFLNFNLGFYFNRGNADYLSPGIGTGVNAGTGAVNGPGLFTGGAAIANQLRPFEFFVGADMGIKWGLSLLYGSANLPTGGYSDLVLSAGAEVQNFDPFVNVRVVANDPATNSSHSFVRGGLKYHWGEWAPYAAVAYWNDQTTTQAKELNAGVGLGRNTKVAEGVRLNYAISYWNSSDSGNISGSRNILPIDVSLEGDAATWLTLRAGLSYRLMDKFNGLSQTDIATGGPNNETTGRIGATLHAGKVDVEWAVGKNQTLLGEGNVDAQQFDVASGFFTAANVTVHW
jgi:hypothetical protein